MRRPHPLRKELPELPRDMRSLPIDWRGYPVPFFVAWPHGQPDHRIADPRKLMRCVSQGLCWICGKPLTPPAVCVIGPMCGVNHVSSEPPSHEACARFAVRGCPFLTKPHAHRRDAGLPTDQNLQEAPGKMLMHNPGLMLLWWTKQVKAFRAGNNPHSPNLLFDVGDPIKVEWWTEGREATRAECEAAIEAGLPRLRQVAQSLEEQHMIDQAAHSLRAWLPPG